MKIFICLLLSLLLCDCVSLQKEEPFEARVLTAQPDWQNNSSIIERFFSIKGYEKLERISSDLIFERNINAAARFFYGRVHYPSKYVRVRVKLEQIDGRDWVVFRWFVVGDRGSSSENETPLNIRKTAFDEEFKELTSLLNRDKK